MAIKPDISSDWKDLSFSIFLYIAVDNKETNKFKKSKDNT